MNENEILNDKQFGFRAGHLTEHAILEPICQVSNAFDDNNFVLGFFIDLSKVLDTVDHKILLEKLRMYEVKGNNLKWFHSYLFNYGNRAWASTTKSKLRKIASQQRQAVNAILKIITKNSLTLESSWKKITF